ncbi:MAG: HAMP domain-containing histidine kinase [Coriobacteriia bacterium]|nr:HAMP domain-containing histidine kinase [Coriobacteriia bacterium]
MKLWQKIFLVTLTLVIIVVNISSLMLMKNNHDLIITREQQSAAARHSYLVFYIQSSIYDTQLYDQLVDLDTARAQMLFQSVLNSQAPTGVAAAIYEGSPTGPVPVYSVNAQPQAAIRGLLNNPDYRDYISTIVEVEGKTYLLIASDMHLVGLQPDASGNEQSYVLATSTDISDTYSLFQSDFNRVRAIGIVSALLVAGILLVLVRVLLRPLQNLSSTTRRIASGDLDRRANVHGNDEVAEVARNLNSMAESIQNNVTDLEQLAESRQTFIGNLAHEMRTPLTSILGYADILRIQKEVSDEQRQEYANVIVSETKRLQSLSGKLMELLSVGSMRTNPTDLSFETLATELAMTLQPIFNSQRMNFVVEMPDVDVVVRADSELLKSLLLNLIDNAIKASPAESEIVLSAIPLTLAGEQNQGEKTSEGAPRPADAVDLADSAAGAAAAGAAAGAGAAGTAEAGAAAAGAAAPAGTAPDTAAAQSPTPAATPVSTQKIRISVRDQGVGIPPEKIPLITEPFFTLDKARTRRHGGAGLGLALCAEIARAHGSKLKVESQLGQGTLVYVDFPLISLGNEKFGEAQ